MLVGIFPDFFPEEFSLSLKDSYTDSGILYPEAMVVNLVVKEMPRRINLLGPRHQLP